MKIGRLAEANPTLSFTVIIKMQLEAAEVGVTEVAVA